MPALSNPCALPPSSLSFGNPRNRQPPRKQPLPILMAKHKGRVGRLPQALVERPSFLCLCGELAITNDVDHALDTFIIHFWCHCRLPFNGDTARCPATTPVSVVCARTFRCLFAAAAFEGAEKSSENHHHCLLGAGWFGGQVTSPMGRGSRPPSVTKSTHALTQRGPWIRFSWAASLRIRFKSEGAI
jgi:hypothetical protein